MLAGWLFAWVLACGGEAPGAPSGGAEGPASAAACEEAAAACASDPSACGTACCWMTERGGVPALPEPATAGARTAAHLRPVEPRLCALDQGHPWEVPDAAGRPVDDALRIEGLDAPLGPGVLVHHVPGPDGSRGYVVYVGATETQATRSWRDPLTKAGFTKAEPAPAALGPGKRHDLVRGDQLVQLAVDATCGAQTRYPNQAMTCVSFRLTRAAAAPGP